MRYLKLGVSVMLFFMTFTTTYAQENSPTQNDQGSSSQPSTEYQQNQPQQEVVTGTTKKAMEWGFFGGPIWSIPSGNAPQLNTDISYANTRVKARTGVNLGFKFNFFISQDLSLEFDVMYNALGQKTQFSGYYHELGYSDETVNYTDVLNYFTFPVLVNYYLNDNIYLKGGLYGAALASAHRREGSITGDYQDADHLYRGGDFGFTAGIGAAMNHFFLEWRYSRGFVDVTFEDDKFYNQNFQLLVGFKFKG
ncbi:PorT family protein [Flammeovirga pectinis]|uniref:PorT family protein n=1 Tax=Flammeovirga pectinis TaxID=2494373 RepID=A0A3Q9FLD7_9BACT|nr:outer membrane beta-barrel protein [Flammeovirga pectinis]AZQ62797.1 PorT family protein [Flammeovirga pectinis]